MVRILMIHEITAFHKLKNTKEAQEFKRKSKYYHGTFKRIYFLALIINLPLMEGGIFKRMLS
jgi:hypothetical protein